MSIATFSFFSIFYVPKVYTQNLIPAHWLLAENRIDYEKVMWISG